MFLAVAFYCTTQGCGFIADTKNFHPTEQLCMAAMQRVLDEEAPRIGPGAKVWGTCIPMETVSI